MKSRCTKGKSCGATCIQQSKWCELELGPKVSKSLTQARERIGVLGLFGKVREHGVKGHKAKFDAVRKQLKGELGHQIRKTEHVQELKRRLQKEGLLPKSEPTNKPWSVEDLFKKKEPPENLSLPKDLRDQLFQLPNANNTTPSERYRRRVAEAEEAARKGEKPPAVEGRQLDRSPKNKTKTLPMPAKNSMDLAMDDISRILRGETPKNIEIASGPGVEGFKARFKLSGSGPPGSATGNTKWAREDAEDSDYALIQRSLRREGSKSYDGWKDSYGSGAYKVGEGAFGTVIRNSDGTYVKRGAVSDTEPALIKRLGEKDLGPRLIAADINGKHPYQEARGVEIREGRIAMGQVPGKPIGEAKPDTKIGGKNVADIYWKAMADLHRLGIAHNDAHIDNILVDSKGKGRWVDLGLAQANPKAALAEAMGIFDTLKNAPASRVMGAAGLGNWQTRRWDGTAVRDAERAKMRGADSWKEFMARFPVASRVWENKSAAQYMLLGMGLSRNDVSSIIDHGIRSPLETYNQGAWAKLSDKQAMQVLNVLYDGI